MCVTRQGFLADDKKRALLLKGQSALNFYIYIGIALFVYCFIACLQHWGITFFISIFYFYSLLRPLFSQNVGTTQTDILYSVTGKRQPLISDTFLISKQINDAETRPLSLPPSASDSLCTKTYNMFEQWMMALKSSSVPFLSLSHFSLLFGILQYNIAKLPLSFC